MALLDVHDVTMKFGELVANDRASFTVEQMVQEALEISQRGYVIQSGRIVQSGTAAEFLDSEEVRKAYMTM